MNVNILTLNNPDYPENLKNIASPPKAIYWTGQPPRSWLGQPKVAVVGSRRISAYGRVVTERITGELAGAGVIIISGLAFGVDITAHRAALAAGGRTVAVIGSGLDHISPVSHLNTARQMLEQGTIISEYPTDSNTYAGNFVVRNRIISGLVDVVLVPEAALKSGSLHTARFALEQGKTVMAIPGNITSPTSEGCNNLIKSGAVPATSADDVFFALKINPAKAKEARNFSGSEAEKKIFELIRQGITAQEELASAAQLISSELASTLTMLELLGYIRPAGSGNWVPA